MPAQIIDYPQKVTICGLEKMTQNRKHCLARVLQRAYLVPSKFPQCKPAIPWSKVLHKDLQLQDALLQLASKQSHCLLEPSQLRPQSQPAKVKGPLSSVSLSVTLLKHSTDSFWIQLFGLWLQEGLSSMIFAQSIKISSGTSSTLPIIKLRPAPFLRCVKSLEIALRHVCSGIRTVCLNFLPSLEHANWCEEGTRCQRIKYELLEFENRAKHTFNWVTVAKRFTNFSRFVFNLQEHLDQAQRRLTLSLRSQFRWHLSSRARYGYSDSSAMPSLSMMYVIPPRKSPPWQPRS